MKSNRIRALTTAAAALASVMGLQMLLRAPSWAFSSGRLAPLMALKYGYRLYYPPGEGPLYVTQYGPMAFLSYAVALLTHTPLMAILVATLSAMVFYGAPILIAVRLAAKRAPERAEACWAAALVFALFTFQSQALSYVAFTVHADAPELGWGALACVVLFGRSENSSERSLILSAFLATLAVWAKQTAFPVMVASAIFLWVTEGRRTALHFSGWACLFGLALSGLFLGIFGSKALIYNVFLLASRYPFFKTGWGVPGAIFWQSPALLKESAWPLLVCVFLFLERGLASGWMRRNRWTLFLLTAALMVPVSLVHKALVAADVNALADTVYYLALAAALGLAESSEKSARIWLEASLAVLILVSAPSIAHLGSDLRDSHNNPRTRAFQFARQHPEEVYFPLDPLATLMADGKLYHCDVGLFDADLFHLAVSDRQFHTYLPARMRYLAFEGHNQFSRQLFPDFFDQGPVAELPGWTVYVKTSK